MRKARNVIGVGTTKSTSPKAQRPYTEMGKEALLMFSRMPGLITKKFTCLCGMDLMLI